jgi:hypothetical protein
MRATCPPHLILLYLILYADRRTEGLTDISSPFLHSFHAHRPKNSQQYLRFQSIPQSKQHFTVTKISYLMLFKEAVSVRIL